MERVDTLLQQLQKQMESKVSLDQMLMTVQMLQSELLHLKSQQSELTSNTSIRIDMPVFSHRVSPPPEQEEKIIEILKVDETEVEAELEEIKKNVNALNKLSSSNKPPLLFDPVEDTPTLVHQQSNTSAPKKEIHQNIPTINTTSLNDKLKQTKIELSDSLQELAIKDLRKAVGVNDRFLFINELFRGDEVMYERSIKTINGFSILPEAEFWIRRELKLKLGWNDMNPIVKQFDQLVKRRFSAI